MLTPDDANLIYELLERCCRANPSDRTAFVQYLGEPHEMYEWRFQGNLGFGGKFYKPHYRAPYIGCYPEDRTPDRDAIIEAVNAQLAQDYPVRR